MAGKLCFCISTAWTRLSLIFFYRRLLDSTRVRWYRWILHASTAFVIITTINALCFSVFLCKYAETSLSYCFLACQCALTAPARPIQAYWAFPPMPGATCMDEGIVSTWAASFTTVADLLVTLLPVPIVMRLQMPFRQRLAVVALLCSGILVTIAGALRTYFLWASLIPTYDETWVAYKLWLAALIETDMAVVCNCGL